MPCLPRLQHVLVHDAVAAPAGDLCMLHKKRPAADKVSGRAGSMTVAKLKVLCQRLFQIPVAAQVGG